MGFCLGSEATAVENDDHVDHLRLGAYELLDCIATEPCSGTADAGSQPLLPLTPTTQPRPPLLRQVEGFATPMTEEISEKRECHF